MSRVLLPLVMLPALLADNPSRTNPPDFRLQVVPAIVYKVDDPGNTGTSSFVFDIAVICSTELRAQPNLRQRGTLKWPICRRAAGVDARTAGEDQGCEVSDLAGYSGRGPSANVYAARSI